MNTPRKTAASSHSIEPVQDGPDQSMPEEWRIKINHQDHYGMTWLHRAALYGNRASIRKIITAEDCDYLLTDNWGRTAADIAYEWGRDPAIARLLTKKQMEQAHRQGVPPCATPVPREPAKPD